MYKADEYRSPYLRQAVEGQSEAARRDPISRWVRYFSRRAAAEAIQTLTTLEHLIGAGDSACGFAGAGWSSLLAQVDDYLATPPPDDPALDEQLREQLEQATAGFCRSVSRSAGAEPAGVLVANPWSFPHRLCLELPELAAVPEVVEPVRWAAESAGRKTVVVDVPSLGFAWIGSGSGPAEPEPSPRRRGLFRRSAAHRSAEPPPMAQLVANLPSPLGRGTRGFPGVRVRNAEPGPRQPPWAPCCGTSSSGPLRSAHRRDPWHLRPQNPRPSASPTIALRLPGSLPGDADDAYSIMAADEIAVTSPGPVLGEVVVRGRLLDRQGRRVAGFRQTTRVWRGSRIIELDIELEPDEPPGPDPWNSYYASRLAWADDAASFYRGVNQAVLPTDAVRMESPHFVDIRGEKARTTLLCGGLPYHRRYGTRKLDTLLVVRGETCRRFRLGLGIDLVQPMAAATAFLAPRTLAAGWVRPVHASGWLFHLDARGVLATHWAPLVESGDGKAEGGEESGEGGEGKGEDGGQPAANSRRTGPSESAELGTPTSPASAYAYWRPTAARSPSDCGRSAWFARQRKSAAPTSRRPTCPSRATASPCPSARTNGPRWKHGGSVYRAARITSRRRRRTPSPTRRRSRRPAQRAFA